MKHEDDRYVMKLASVILMSKILNFDRQSQEKMPLLATVPKGRCSAFKICHAMSCREHGYLFKTVVMEAMADSQAFYYLYFEMGT